MWNLPALLPFLLNFARSRDALCILETRAGDSHKQSSDLTFCELNMFASQLFGPVSLVFV